MPCDITGQHAGIGRMQVACDQGEAQAGQRVHGKIFQHGQMAVAATDENKVFDDRYCVGAIHASKIFFRFIVIFLKVCSLHVNYKFMKQNRGTRFRSYHILVGAEKIVWNNFSRKP